MLRFILKGIIRDRSRSLFPVMVCSAGVILLFLGGCFIEGSLENFIHSNSSFSTGHVKIQSFAAVKDSGGSLELALETDEGFHSTLKSTYPGFRWTRRTNFGGLLDIPDDRGETRSQSPVGCIAVDMLSADSVEVSELNIKESLAAGKLPAHSNDILISASLAERLSVKINDKATLLCSTVDGASTASNFTVSGFINFGIPMLDRGTILMDVAGADNLLDMEDYTSEILGFRLKGFDEGLINRMALEYNSKVEGDDEYRPYMITLMEQNNLQSLLDTMNGMLGFMLFLFTFLMAMVLWNAGLISGIRRFSEVGVRLAIGEKRRHIVFTMLLESLATGLIGTTIGILLALPLAYYLQEVGVDYTETMKDFSMMISGVMKAKITMKAVLTAIIPGVLASFLGMVMASISIYQRKTASLFKELET